MMQIRVIGSWVPGMLLLLIGVGNAQAVPCQNNLPASNPDSVYIDEGDGTVTDSRYGLMWKQCAEGLSGANCQTGSAQTFTWANALAHAEASTFGGYTDWRLPNVKELSSLVEDCRVSPSINTNLFPNTPSNRFWSGSPFAYDSLSAWGVDFGNGSADHGYRSGSGRVRLVRGGGADSTDQTEKQITSSLGTEYEPAWSLDGSRFLYRTSSPNNLVTADLTGNNIIQLTNMPEPRRAWGGVYRPGTDRIYYLDNSPSGPDFWWICWTNLDGSAGRNKVWMVPGGETISPISFSPDGTQFVFIHRQEMSLHIMNADGTLHHKISDVSAVGTVSWGRGINSNKILYGKKINGLNTIASVDINGANDTLITDITMGDSIYQSWSPDGESFVFTLKSDNQIYSMKYDGSHIEKLTDNQKSNIHPKISPDGNSLLYAAREADGFYNIYLLNLQ